jgi:alpha,alpha-trehalase
LDAATKELEDALADVPGAKVERKRYAVAVHYRNTPKDRVATVREKVKDISSKRRDLRQRGGKKVFELQPHLDWDKGKAVVWLLETLDLAAPDVVPVYLGDDLTDEDAFRALQERGLRFVVGPLERRTEADYLLKDVHEVERLLRDITRLLRKRNG